MPDVITLASPGNQMSTYEELYREFLDDRTLVFNDEVGDNVVEDFIMYILKWNKEDQNLPVDARRKIKIFISSPGGSTFSANIMVDVILNSKTPVIGIGLDLVASAAYSIYLACHERYAFSTTAFLQHEGEMAIENSRSKFKQTVNFFSEVEERSKDFILSRTNMTEEFYDEVYEQEFWFLSRRGKELGVVHKIIGVDCDLDEVI